VELGEHGDRVLKAFELFRSSKSSRIIISGGSRRLNNGGVEEPVVTKSILVAWGVPDSAIVLETQSTNTRDSARALEQLTDELGINSIALVTSAYHMPRAHALVTKLLPVDVHPAQSNIIIGDIQPHITLWIPDAQSMSRSTLALHEYVGMAYNAMFPVRR